MKNNKNFYTRFCLVIIVFQKFYRVAYNVSLVKMGKYLNEFEKKNVYFLPLFRLFSVFVSNCVNE